MKRQKGKRSMNGSYQITEWVKDRIRPHIPEGGLCIDATMGKGNDTLFLCETVGKEGRVIAFDIQAHALEETRKRLKRKLPFCNYELIWRSHETMAEYALPETVDCIVFNLGYLPTGDHHIATRAASTLQAIRSGLTLLKRGGVMSICIYSGGDSGFEERDAVLGFLKELDSKQYLVMVTEYYNRPNNPPIPAFVVKL